MDTIAIKYVKLSLAIQRNLALTVKSATSAERVYVLDLSNYFDTSSFELIEAIRVVRGRNGEYALISSASQNSLTAESYMQFMSDFECGVDEIGVYV